MEITVPNVNDYEAINKLAIQVHNCHVNWRPDFFVSCDNLISKDDLADMIDNNGIFVAKINNEIVAYATIYIKEREHKGFRYRKQLDIESICVEKKYRHQGIGTKLFEFIKDYALKNECTDLFLNVNEENISAINLYEKMGMKVRSIAYSMQIDNTKKE